jgi:predicted nucleotidyltransferase
MMTKEALIAALQGCRAALEAEGATSIFISLASISRLRATLVHWYSRKGNLWYQRVMKRDDIIHTLKAREGDLRAHGVVHAALFGSVARDEQAAGSDIDILVDLHPAVIVTMFDYPDVKDYVAGLFSGGVDVIDREALKPRLRPQAMADAIYAF